MRAAGVAATGGWPGRGDPVALGEQAGPVRGLRSDPAAAWSLGGDLGDRGPGGGLVDDGLAVGVGGDEGLDGQLVHGAGQPAGDLVDQRGVVVGDQSVAATPDDEADSDELD